MRVLFDHPNPFLLAHGGMQIQIEQTFAALTKIGISVEHLRWWDDAQEGNIIHYFGRPSVTYLAAAQQKGIRVVLAQILTGLGSRPPWKIQLEKGAIGLGKRYLPWMIKARFGWETFSQADACAANTEWERHLMHHVFGAPPERTHLIPNGVEEVFLNSQRSPRGEWLVCTATITERKRVLELAEAAVQAKTPLWIIGKPYAEADPYFQRFQAVFREHPQMLRFEGAIGDRASLAHAYRSARGFVLLSTKETRSLAAEEAAACECPLLLSDLPWAKSVFAQGALFCPVPGSRESTAEWLRKFYDQAPTMPAPARPLSWVDVAEKLRSVYQAIL